MLAQPAGINPQRLGTSKRNSILASSEWIDCFSCFPPFLSILASPSVLFHKLVLIS
jgi:hypothetical protein